MPEVFDLRLIPIAYGIGYVCGLCVAVARTLVRRTALRDEASVLPQLWGLTCALGYTGFLAFRLLWVP